MKIKRIITIDPSINFCGMAIFYGKKLIEYELLQPKNNSDDYIDKSFSIFLQVKRKIYALDIDTMVIEVPDNFGAAGYLARESGSVQKLTFVCGMLISLRTKIHVVCKLPREWKGQLPKKVVYNRLNNINKYKDIDFHKINNNIADAIAIGHSYLYGRV